MNQKSDNKGIRLFSRIKSPVLLGVEKPNQINVQVLWTGHETYFQGLESISKLNIVERYSI